MNVLYKKKIQIRNLIKKIAKNKKLNWEETKIKKKKTKQVPRRKLMAKKSYRWLNENG